MNGLLRRPEVAAAYFKALKAKHELKSMAITSYANKMSDFALDWFKVGFPVYIKENSVFGLENGDFVFLHAFDSREEMIDFFSCCDINYFEKSF